MFPPETRGVDPLEGNAPTDDWPAGRPYPTRPYPTRPYPTRPYPTRPYPTRPYGAAQPAWRPYPTRPYPTRPYPTREEDVVAGAPDRGLDADEWTTDVSALFLSRSAIVRLGGRLLVGEGRIPVPRLRRAGAPDYVKPPEPPEPPKPPKDVKPPEPPKPPKDADPQWSLQRGAEKTYEVHAELGNLVPSRKELAWKVVLPDDVARDLAEQPEPAWAVKEDIADALAVRADRAMLAGHPPLKGIKDLPDVAPGGDPAGLAAVARALLAKARGGVRSSFRDAGWILSPESLDDIRELMQGNRTWDSTQLVMPDGEDGGFLLGYPFVATQAAEERIYFSADWSEAWIGMRRRVVTVSISKDAHFKSDETVIRAVSEHDFLVRRPELFAVAEV
jgi:hypothetical protein